MYHLNRTESALKEKGSGEEIKHANCRSVPALSVGEVRIPPTAFNSDKSQSKSIHGHSLAVLPRAWVQSLLTTLKPLGTAKKKKKNIITEYQKCLKITLKAKFITFRLP